MKEKQHRLRLDERNVISEHLGTHSKLGLKMLTAASIMRIEPAGDVPVLWEEIK